MTEFIQSNKGLIKLALVFLTLFLLVTFFGKLKEYRFIGSGMDASNTITVTGTGKVERAPDTAKISFTVRNESRDIKTAQTAVSEKIDAVKKTLMDAGIEEKHIKTSSYNSYPVYDYSMSRQTLRGYEVAHAIMVSVKDLEKTETVVGIVGSLGASDIAGPNFGFEDDDAVSREARELAIADAKEEAKTLARQLGVRLVRIVSFNENVGGGFPVPMYERAVMNQAKDAIGAAPTIPVGTQNVETTVTIVYEIR